MVLSLLLLRNFSHKNPNICSRIPFWLSNGTTSYIKLFSTSQSSSVLERDLPKIPDPRPSLSARLSFVFDQIDVIDKDRSSKDEALQRIRSWRETKKIKNEEDELGDSVGSNFSQGTGKESLFKKEVEIVHPWPEWVELMERLLHQSYFDPRRRDEDKIVQDLSIDISSFPQEGFDFSRDWTAVRTACLNFGRDRFDILRSLSRKDIQVLVGHGCPSTDKKVVFSGKMLRKHVHIDEGDVCSSCNLRSSCEKAYLLPRKEDEARTIDVMRVLLTYGFDPVKDSVENKSLLKLKTVKTVVRKLLHEVVKLSAVPIDPNLPPPVIKKPPPKVKQPPPPPRKRVGRDDIEMKKGDWLCPKCDFMNFAKNTVCLQCDGRRPKRQLLPGEWECPECNFLNYRRNMECFHCEHKRPPDEFVENQMEARQHGSRTRAERVTDVPVGSNSWNFDFDDNESDGADVAAFEYADPPRIAEDSPIESHVQGGNSRGFEDDSFESSRIPRSTGRGRYSDLDQRKSTKGFDDFEDEEDDINSYELETPNNNSMHEPLRDFSEVEGFSESDDFDVSDHHSHPRSSPVQRKSFSDEKDFVSREPPIYSNQKSSHVKDSRTGIRDRGQNASYRVNAFGSESDTDGDADHSIGSNQRRRNYSNSKKGGSRRGHSGSEDVLPFGSESDDDDLHPGKSKFGGSRASSVRGTTFRNCGHLDSRRDEEFRSTLRKNDRGNSFGDADRGRGFGGRNNRESGDDGYSERRNFSGNANFGRSSRGSFRNGRESNDNGYSKRQTNDRDRHGQNPDRDRYGRNSDRDRHGWNSDRDRHRRNSDRDRDEEGRGHRKIGRSNRFDDRSDVARDFSDDRPRRRIIER